VLDHLRVPLESQVDRYPQLSTAEKTAALDLLASTKPDFRDFVQHQRAR
jgi:hypothetical protein